MVYPGPALAKRAGLAGAELRVLLAKWILPIAFIVISVVAGTTSWPVPTSAHGWYPKECCNDTDCAPVERVAQFVPTGEDFHNS